MNQIINSRRHMNYDTLASRILRRQRIRDLLIEEREQFTVNPAFASEVR